MLLLGSVGSDQTVVVVPALGGHALAIFFWIPPVELPFLISVVIKGGSQNWGWSILGMVNDLGLLRKKTFFGPLFLNLENPWDRSQGC